jgi:nuclear transport factor 2 (NTF2) superfamily protein
MSEIIKPPFTDVEVAKRKVQIAEDLWNTRDPQRVAFAYTEDTEWRNRTEFVKGRAEVIALLERKWNRELDYRLRKELWGFRENRMAVTFFYEWHDDSGQWYRSYGNELWEFAPNGLMARRLANSGTACVFPGFRTP